MSTPELEYVDYIAVGTWHNESGIKEFYVTEFNGADDFDDVNIHTFKNDHYIRQAVHEAEISALKAEVERLREAHGKQGIENLNLLSNQCPFNHAIWDEYLDNGKCVILTTGAKYWINMAIFALRGEPIVNTTRQKIASQLENLTQAQNVSEKSNDR